MPSRITTEETDAIILAMIQPDKYLAKLLHLTERQIIERRYALRNRTRSKYGHTQPPSPLRGQENKVIEMLYRGMTQTAIAAEFGCTVGVVAGFIHRKNLRKRSRNTIRRFDDLRVMYLGRN